MKFKSSDPVAVPRWPERANMVCEKRADASFSQSQEDVTDLD